MMGATSLQASASRCKRGADEFTHRRACPGGQGGGARRPGRDARPRRRPVRRPDGPVLAGPGARPPPALRGARGLPSVPGAPGRRAGGPLPRAARGAEAARPGTVDRAGLVPGPLDDRLRVLRRPVRPRRQARRGRRRPPRLPGRAGGPLRAPHGPARRHARRLRGHPAGDLPGLRAGQLHLRGRARLGVDHVQPVPVGPQLVQPARVPGAGRRAAVPGQPRRGGGPARRGRVHLEAAGHQLPEPAGGARPHAGAARLRPDRRAGRGLQGRGDRLARRPRLLPGRRPASRQGVRPRLPQQPDGAAVVGAGHARRAPGHQGAGRVPGQAAEHGLGHLRALPRRHRLGDHRGGRGRGRLGRPGPPGVPGRLLRRDVPRQLGPGRRLPGQPCDRGPAHERDDGQPGRAGARPGARGPAAGRPVDPAHPARARADLRLRRHPARLHGRRARHAERLELPRRPRPRRRQPLAAPPAHGLGAGRPPPRPGLGSRPHLRRPGRAGQGAAGHAPPARRHPAGDRGPRQASLLAFVRRHALGPLLAVHNLTERTVRLDRGVLDHFGLGHAVDRLAGGPPPVDGDALVLAPYQAVWLTAPAPGQAYNRLQP